MANSDVKAFYNNTMPGKFGDDYEYNRWFKDAIQRVGYEQTKSAISRHVLSATMLTPSAILELVSSARATQIPRESLAPGYSLSFENNLSIII